MRKLFSLSAITVFLSIFFLFYNMNLALASPQPSADDGSGERQFLFKNTTGATRYIVYQEFDQWIVDVYSEPNGKLPERIEHRQFMSLAEAHAHIPKKSKELFREVKERAAEFFTEVKAEFFTEVKNEQIWVAQNQWNQDWENKYSEWIRNEVKEDFFLFHKIATDCADAAYALRWIFSRIHGLPVANQLAGGNILMTNETMKAEWSRLPTDAEWSKDRRFRAALKYVLSMTYTHTLFGDSSPVALNPQTFKPGIFHISLGGDSGHTMIVRDVHTDNGYYFPIYVLASTVPQEIRLLDFHPLLYADFNLVSGGLLRFRWPQKTAQGKWRLVAKTQMYDYSEEQYGKEFTEGIMALLKKINPNFNPESQIQEGVNAILEMYKQRVSIVEEGYNYCRQNDCSPGSKGYENYSTPSRDKRLKNTILSLNTFVEQLRQLNPDAQQIYEQSQKQARIQIGDGEYNLLYLQQLARADFFNSDPRLPTAKRWNISPIDYNNRIMDELRELLKRRKVVLEQTGCVENQACEPGTEAFEKSQTFDIDGRVHQLLYGLHSYCELVDRIEFCKSQQENLEHLTVKYDSQDFSIKEFVKVAAWFNAYPQWETSIRSGAFAKTVPHVWINDSIKKTQVVGGHHLLLEGLRDVYLLNKNSNEVKPLGLAPDRITYLTVHPTAPLMAWSEKNAGIKIKNLVTEKMTEIQSLGASPYSLGWTHQFKLFAFGSPNSIYDVDPVTVKATLWGAFPSGLMTTFHHKGRPDFRGPIWLWALDKKIFLINMNGSFAPVSVNAPMECGNDQSELVYSTDHIVLFECYINDTSRKATFVYEFATELLKPVENAGHVFIKNNWFLRAKSDPNEGGYEIVQLDRNYQLIQVFSDFQGLSSQLNGHILADYEKIFSFEKSNPEIVYTAPPNFLIIAASEKEVLMFKTEEAEPEMWLSNYSGSRKIKRNRLVRVFSVYANYKTSLYFGLSRSELRGEIFNFEKFGSRPILTGAFMTIARRVHDAYNDFKKIPLLGVEGREVTPVSDFFSSVSGEGDIPEFGDQSAFFPILPNLTLVLSGQGDGN